MVKKIVSELLGPFQSLRFHKPKEWAENLKPAASRPAVQETPNALQQAIQKAQKRLLNQQNLDDGYWCGDLRANTRSNRTPSCCSISSGEANPPRSGAWQFHSLGAIARRRMAYLPQRSLGSFRHGKSLLGA